MRFENRKKPRKRLNYPAIIEFENDRPFRTCMLADASDSGARLTFKDMGDLPDTFVLRLSRDGRNRRRCRVVWRDEHQVGIEYMKEKPKPGRPSRARPRSTAP